LSRVGKSWKKLEEVGRSWKKLDEVGKSWKKLEEVGKSWKNLESYEVALTVNARSVFGGSKNLDKTKRHKNKVLAAIIHHFARLFSQTFRNHHGGAMEVLQAQAGGRYRQRLKILSPT
jgi:hypothetical protein